MTLSPASIRPGFQHSQDEILCRDQANPLLDMAKMGRNTHKRNAEEPFRSHFRNLQGVKLLSLPSRQDLHDCPAQGSQPFATKRSEERRVGKECRSRWSPYH